MCEARCRLEDGHAQPTAVDLVAPDLDPPPQVQRAKLAHKRPVRRAPRVQTQPRQLRAIDDQRPLVVVCLALNQLREDPYQ